MSAAAPPPPPRPGDRYDVPPEGSLGLLALGYRGLEAWRAVRAARGLDPRTPAPPPSPDPA